MQYYPPPYEDGENEQVLRNEKYPNRNGKKRQSGGQDSSNGCDQPFDRNNVECRITRFGVALLIMSFLLLASDASRFGLYWSYTGGTYLNYIYGTSDSIKWRNCEATELSTVSNTPVALSSTTSSPIRDNATSSVVTGDANRVTGSSTTRKPVASDDKFKSVVKEITRHVVTVPYSIQWILQAFSETSHSIPKVWLVVLQHASLASWLLQIPVSLFAISTRAKTRSCVVALFGVICVVVLFLDLALAILVLLRLGILLWTQFPQVAWDTFSFLPPCSLLRYVFMGLDGFAFLVLVTCLLLIIAITALFFRGVICCNNIDDNDDEYESRNIWVV